MALVSVVIPSYNYASFLAEAVQSALQQSHREIEVVIVDDGSTDNTAEVAGKLVQQDSRVRYIHQHNQGLSAARNTGIKHAAGDFLVFLDADDVLHEEKIAAHLEHFATDDSMDISYGSSRYFLSDQPEKTYANIALNEQDWMPKVSGAAATVLPALVVNNIMPVCSAMMRRRVVDVVGDFDITLKSLEDWDYWLRAATAGLRFGYRADARLAAFIRVHGVSMSQNSLRMLQVQYLLRRRQIPRYLQQLSDRQLVARMQRDNNKRRLRCLVSLAQEMGASSTAYRALCAGESLFMLLKLRYRLLRKKSNG